jgi:oligoendopeptidase F
LSAGGSETPDELGHLVGVDLTDPDFWNAGLQVVDELVSEAEALAAAQTGSL